MYKKIIVGVLFVAILFTSFAFPLSAGPAPSVTLNQSFQMICPVRTSDGVLVKAEFVDFLCTDLKLWSEVKVASGKISFTLPDKISLYNSSTGSIDDYDVISYRVGNGYDSVYQELKSTSSTGEYSTYTALVSGGNVDITVGSAIQTHQDWCGWFLSGLIEWLFNPKGAYDGWGGSPGNGWDPANDSARICIEVILGFSAAELRDYLSSIDENVANIWGAIDGDYPGADDIPSKPDGLEDYQAHTDAYLDDAKDIDDSVNSWVDKAKFPSVGDLSPEISDEFGGDLSSPPDLSSFTSSDGWSGFIDGLYWLWTIHPFIYTMLALLLGFVLLTIFLKAWGFG